MQFLMQMELCSTSMAVAIAGMAVVFGVPAAMMPEIVKVVVAFAVAAFAVVFALKIFKLVKKMEHHCEFIAEKCSYMEQRMDAGAARIADVCRHMQQIFEEFDEDKNEAKDVESKWWWVQRRFRQLYEDFCSSRTMQFMSFASMKATWSLLQLEVKLRLCRDLVAVRFYADPAAEMDEEQAALEHCMKNMIKAEDWCEYWRPMSMQDFESYEATTGNEEVLVSQVKERLAELKQYMQSSSNADLYAGLQLEGIFAGSAGSN